MTIEKIMKMRPHHLFKMKPSRYWIIGSMNTLAWSLITTKCIRMEKLGRTVLPIGLGIIGGLGLIKGLSLFLKGD